MGSSLSRLLGLLVVLVAVAAGVAAVAFLWPESEPSEATDVGTVREIAAAGVVYIGDPPLFVVATADGFVALSAFSQHVEGERVLYCSSSSDFSSPAHGERFDRLGRYVAGPARADLDRYPIRVDSGDVIVVTEELIPRRDRSDEHLPTRGASCDGPGEEPPGFYPVP